MKCREALLLVLDHVDFTNKACHFTEMVGAVLPKEVIAKAQEALLADPDKKDPCHKELMLIMSVTDYTQGCCSLTSLIGAALDTAYIDQARESLRYLIPEEN